ncbi:MAG: GreA/GreB family elongation factor [Patescibacteria group bacterium]|nr:GreA/GreB family elongation factor [Patescibacteria group bacterium]
MSMKLYFTKSGIQKLRVEIGKLTLRLNELQAQTAHVAEVGGDQYHDNASYDLLVIDIRGVDHRLSAAHKALNHAVVIDPPTTAEKVRIGTKVTIVDTVDGHESTWEIVGYGESDPDKDLLAYNTPLVAAIMGKTEGQEINTFINGVKARIKIKKIELGGVS